MHFPSTESPYPFKGNICIEVDICNIPVISYASHTDVMLYLRQVHTLLLLYSLKITSLFAKKGAE